MCSDEVYGDWYRPCGHFVKSYYSGNRTDCGSQFCALSSAHAHTARNCPCPKTAADNRRIVSMFHWKCDDCKEALAAENARRGVGR